MLRRWLAAAAGAPVLLLCACTPPYFGEIGFTREGDQVIALVETCEGTSSSALYLEATTGASFDEPRRTVHFESTDSGEVPLGPIDDLIASFGDERFVVEAAASFWARGPQRIIDAEHLAALTEGEIYAGLRIDDRAEFAAWVAEKCGDLPPTDQVE